MDFENIHLKPNHKDDVASDQLIEKYMDTDSVFSSHKQTSQAAPQPKEKKHSLSTHLQHIEDRAKEMLNKSLFSSVIHLLTPLHEKGVGTPSTYCLIATAYHQKNAFKQARDSYKKSLEIDPTHVESLVNLSLLRFDLGDYDQGMDTFVRAEQERRLHQESEWKSYISKQHIQSANAYYEKGYHHEALLEFLKAYVDTKNTMPLPVQLRIVRCLWKLDRKTDAISKLKTLRKANPISCEVSLLLGYLYFQSNQITAAIHEWERVLKLDPKNSQAIKYLSEIHHLQSVKENSFA